MRRNNSASTMRCVILDYVKASGAYFDREARCYVCVPGAFNLGNDDPGHLRCRLHAYPAAPAMSQGRARSCRSIHDVVRWRQATSLGENSSALENLGRF